MIQYWLRALLLGRVTVAADTPACEARLAMPQVLPWAGSNVRSLRPGAPASPSSASRRETYAIKTADSRHVDVCLDST